MEFVQVTALFVIGEKGVSVKYNTVSMRDQENGE